MPVNPVPEIDNFEEGFLKLMLKIPFASAVTAFLDPTSVTVAKGTGEPELSFTIPVTAFFWAKTITVLSKHTINSDNSFLMTEF